MKNLLILFFLIGSFASAQEEVRTIRGKITYLDTPLSGATVMVSGNGGLITSDTDGAYSIQAEEGDILLYSYPGMRTLEILVEDVTRILNVELLPEVNQLEEVVVSKTVIKSQNEMRAEYATNPNIINTAFGFIDKETSNFPIRILEGKDLNAAATDLSLALQNRFVGMRVVRSALDISGTSVLLRGYGVNMRPAVYDVDGLIMTDFPYFLAVENIERIAIMSGLGSTVKYGTIGAGGVVVINTKGGNIYPKDPTGIANSAQLQGNIYQNDAKNVFTLKADVPLYEKQLMAATTTDEAKKVYRDLSGMYAGSYHFVLDAYDHFYTIRKAPEFADGIIEAHMDGLKDNPLALKALAYHYQAQEGS